MAYNYLELTNQVINRFNEVELTDGGFASARGFQIQCKNAVNNAILHINQREFTWPFNHSTQTETLVAGTTRYTVPSTEKVVDYDTFRIVKDDALSCPGRSLKVMDYKQYLDNFVEQEDDTTVEGGLPEYVVRTPDDNFLLYPYPDKAYSLKYESYGYTTKLSAYDDTSNIPEQYEIVIIDGAVALGYQYRGELDLYMQNWERFQDGITQMQNQLINRYDYVRSGMIIRVGDPNTSYISSS